METHAHIIIERIGVQALAKLVGVGDGAVRNAKAKGLLPSSWFDMVEQECLERGIPCPREAFSFVRSEGE